MPVDELDKTCKKLKDCYKCVKQAYGGKCTPENVEYDIFFRGQEILVGNQPGTCGRAIYECDLQYAKGLSKVFFVDFLLDVFRAWIIAILNFVDWNNYFFFSHVLP